MASAKVFCRTLTHFVFLWILETRPEDTVTEIYRKDLGLSKPSVHDAPVGFAHLLPLGVIGGLLVCALLFARRKLFLHRSGIHKKVDE